MDRPRFHLDESADHRIGTGLRRRDRDCTTTQDEGLISSPDEDQFAFAVRERRVLITNDHDFRQIVIDAAAEQNEHPGVIICAKKTSLGKKVNTIDQMASEMDAADFRNRIFYV